jgi:hypothetical protein
MKGLLVVAMLLALFWSVDAIAQAGYCDCYGGLDADGNYWQLLDFNGTPLQDGDWVYAAWTGPDGEIDPPDASGFPTDDDLLLPISKGEIEYGTFFTTVASWQTGTVDYEGNPRHPVDGDRIYCRIFDAPQDSIGSGNYYADSQIHQIVWKLGDELYCLFPDDPGGGHTDTPLPEGPVKSDVSEEEPQKPDVSEEASSESEPCEK